ncbi:MAG TPA: hypothetical protein VGQ83_19865, partial [Polyangia bacterium]
MQARRGGSRRRGQLVVPLVLAGLAGPMTCGRSAAQVLAEAASAAPAGCPAAGGATAVGAPLGSALPLRAAAPEVPGRRAPERAW